MEDAAEVMRISEVYKAEAHAIYEFAKEQRDAQLDAGLAGPAASSNFGESLEVDIDSDELFAPI